jgi:hypothetical protein
MSHATEDIETQIVKNGIALVNTYSGDSTTWNQGSQSIVVHLNVGLCHGGAEGNTVNIGASCAPGY